MVGPLSLSAEGGLGRGGVSARAEAPRGARSRGSQARRSLPFFSEGRSSTLERGGDVVHCWRPRRGGLERDEDCSASSRGSQMGRIVELGRGPSADRASLGPGEDLGAVGELEELYGVRVQSDDGVVIIGGFVDHQSARRLFPLQDRRRVVRLPLRIGGRRFALARHDCRV